MQNPFEPTSAPPRDAATAVIPGAGGLFYLRAAELVLSLVSFLFFRFALDVIGTESFSTASTAFNFVWISCSVIGLALLIPFSRGRRGTMAGGPASAAIVLAAAGIAVEVLFLLPDLSIFSGDFGRLLGLASISFALAFDIVFWLAISRSTSGLASWLAPIYFTLRGFGVLASLPSVALDFETYRRLFLEDGLGTIIGWVRWPIGIAANLIVLSVLRRLMTGRGTSAIAAAPAPLEAQDTSARDLIIGSLWLGGGLIVTVVSYAAASGGGRYVITTGAVVYGLIRVIRGLTKLGAPKTY